MAMFHFSAKVIGRSSGRSAVAAAAYRAGGRLHDERLDRDHDFSNKSGVVHSEVMLPENAPEHLSDREKLWNAVEAAEVRKDAQLAREAEFAIPREMTQAQGIELARDFAQSEFVDRGMIADLNVHWDMGADGMAKPHAHVMLTMREVGDDGFGAKVREWNATAQIEQWRERWADHVNARLAELDIDARIDHRSLQAQGIDLEPQHKIGPAASRLAHDGLQSERIEEHREIARANGERIIANPTIALDAITHQQATFTTRDMAMFAHRHSDGKDQFDSVMSAMRGSPEMIALGTDRRGEDRFTSREMLETEQRLHRASELMAERERHRVDAESKAAALARAEARGLHLSGEQRDAFDHVTSPKDLSVVVGYAGTGKSAMLGVAREAWERAGFTVRGAALSGIAAEGLENGSGIASRTIASMEHGWAQGRDLLTLRDVLVIDEAGMTGTRQMERVLSHAADAGAKVVLVGDPQQLQAIEAGAAFRAIHERHGGIEITEVRRQHLNWQRDATRHLATGRTGEAIHAYAARDMVHAADTREAARSELIDRWDRERITAPNRTRIILTHTNTQVKALNEAARDKLRSNGELGNDIHLKVERGDRNFAENDRIMFLRNERELGVKNGTLGTVEQVNGTSMTVRTDDGSSIAFDIKHYAHIDHGYAATIHKVQGATVDRTHVLATPGMDSHGSYVAMSRHRDGMALHYGKDDFADQEKLIRTLSRERAKDMASDYTRADPTRAFAERRGISFRERVTEIARTGIEKARGIFDGLKLGPARSPERSMFDDFVPSAPKARDAPLVGQDRTIFARAVQRHARAINAIGAMREKGLPALPHQQSQLDKTRDVLDRLQPKASQDIERAYKADPALVKEASAGRTQRAINAMQLERELRTNPELRADRFVERWQKLGKEADAAWREGDHRRFERMHDAQDHMTKELFRDAQLDSILSNRRQALGLMPGTRAYDRISRELEASIGRSLGRGMGIGM